SDVEEIIETEPVCGQGEALAHGDLDRLRRRDRRALLQQFEFEEIGASADDEFPIGNALGEFVRGLPVDVVLESERLACVLPGTCAETRLVHHTPMRQARKGSAVTTRISSRRSW